MQVSIGDVVRINCAVSRYHGVEGTVYAIQASSGYVMVDMPKGTEKRIESIAENRILKALKRERKRKNRPEPPAGDPQWFPALWLQVIASRTKSAVTG